MFFWAVAIVTAASCSAATEDALRSLFTTPVASNLRSLQAAPASADGIVYAYFYGTDGCTGQVVASTGRLTNKCILAYDDHNSSTPTASYKYTCANGVASTITYRDTTCTDVQVTLTQDLLCKNDDPNYPSAQLFCNTDPSVVPLPATGTYTTEINYDSPTSCSGTNVIMDQYKSYLNDVCIKNATYNFPTKTAYTNAACTGAGTATTLSATCTPVTTYPVGDNNHLASTWTEAAVVPTGQVYSPGFAYAYFYDQPGCTGNVIASTGHLTGKCIMSYDDYNSSAPTSSHMYSCNGEYFFTQYYSDTACQNPTTSLDQKNICANAVGGTGISTTGFCNNDPSKVPLPTAGAFTTQINYGSPASCALPTPISDYKSYMNGKCFPQSGGQSIKYQYPTMTTYTANSDCTGVSTVTTLTEECVSVASYPVGDQNPLAYEWTDSDDIETGYVKDDGYLYFNYYQADDCNNQIVAVSGQLTNKCLLIYGDDSGTATGSHMWSCNDKTSFESVFSDLECQVPTTSNNKTLGCANFGGGRYGSVEGMCNANPNRLPLTSDRFVSEILYNAPGSCSVPAEFNSFLNNNCIRGSTLKSYSFEYPQVVFYNDATCTKPNKTETIPSPTTCVAVAQYPANNQVAAQWHYGYVPYEASPAPTAVPTSAPSQMAYENGFVYVNFYEESGCTGNIVTVEGRQTGVCMQAYGDVNSATVTGSYIFTCDGDASHTHKFSDANCQVSVGSLDQPMGTCNRQLGTFGSNMGMCSADASKLPLPSSTFVTDVQWNSPTSCGDKVAMFTATADGHCVTASNVPAYKYDFPIKHTYVADTCTGPIATNETVSTSCVSVTTYPSSVATAHQMFYGDVTFGDSSSSEELSTGAIVGIAVGGAAGVVLVAAGAYFFMGSGAAAAGSSGVGASAVNPLASAV